MKIPICNHCGKLYASPQSLWNHKRRCNGSLNNKVPTINSNKQSLNQPNNPAMVTKGLSDAIIKTKPRPNPKIEALVDAIINDGVQNVSEEGSATKRKKFMESSPEISKISPPSTFPQPLGIPPAPKKIKKTLASNEVDSSKKKLFSVKKTLPRVDLSAKVV